MERKKLDERLVIRQEPAPNFCFFRLLIPEVEAESVTVEWKNLKYTYTPDDPLPIPQNAHLKRRIISALTDIARNRILNETDAGGWISSQADDRTELWRAFEVTEEGRFIGFRAGFFDKECAATFRRMFVERRT